LIGHRGIDISLLPPECALKVLSPAFPDSQNSHPKKWGRAVLETLLIMAPIQIAYWNRHQFLEDWDYRLTWSDQTMRFFTLKATKFDSNAFTINWQHILSGGLFYMCPRTNYLSIWDSFLFNVATNFYWEYIIEWREVVSINDGILSIFGGTALGETWYQVTKYFCEQDGTIYKILGFLNPLLKFNRWLDRNKSKDYPTGPEAGWHEFSLFLGARRFRSSSKSRSQDYFYMGSHMQIMHLPEYGKPGRVNRKVKDTLFSDVYLDMTRAKRRYEELNLFCRFIAFGRFKQNINEQSRGFSCYFGLGSAFTLFRKHRDAFYDSKEVRIELDPFAEPGEPRRFRDKLCIVHMFGPVYDFTWFGRNFKLRFVQDAYLDFAQVNAFAFNKYSEIYPIEGTKTTLLYYGYYYGIGATVSSALTVNYRNIELAAQIKYHLSHSIEGLDRFQDKVTDDFHLRDSRLLWQLSLGYQFKRTPFELRVSYEGIDRRGKIKTIFEKEQEVRLFAGLNFKF